MSWLSQDFDKQICLTCQHFRIGRRVKSIGRNIFIEYDSVKGGCGLFNDFPKLWNERVIGVSFCRYRRWVELPDKD